MAIKVNDPPPIFCIQVERWSWSWKCISKILQPSSATWSVMRNGHLEMVYSLTQIPFLYISIIFKPKLNYFGVELSRFITLRWLLIPRLHEKCWSEQGNWLHVFIYNPTGMSEFIRRHIRVSDLHADSRRASECPRHSFLWSSGSDDIFPIRPGMGKSKEIHAAHVYPEASLRFPIHRENPNVVEYGSTVLWAWGCGTVCTESEKWRRKGYSHDDASIAASTFHEF